MLFPALALAHLCLIAAVLKNRTSALSPPKLTFDRRGALFTPAVRSFYGVLQQALNASFVVFGKVRLGEAKGLSRTLSLPTWISTKSPLVKLDPDTHQKAITND